MDPDLAARPPTLKVPLHPALLLLLFLGCGATLGRWLPQPLGLAAPWRLWVPGTVLLAAFSLLGWSLWTFWRHRASPEYGDPVLVLLRTGPYRFSRNPLFITNALLYTGLALALDNLWAVCLVPGLVFALDRVVSTREEPFLVERFGEAYADYRRQVRRWL